MEKNINKEKFHELALLFNEIMEEMILLNKHSLHFGTDTELTRPEVHLIKAIKENPSSYVTKLAEISDVTKGAVSQMLVKLNKKGMIKKEIDSLNKSRIIIELTEKGEQAYIGHEKFHENFDNEFLKIFSQYSDEELNFLIEVMIKSKKQLKNYNKNS